ncbi:MAG: hypothetical protein GF355_13110 [Candidatus Eisenbacteria bacterium]|nr:hypothetical protein [Candidatus Eisenbacteria bacterium]
MSETISSRSGIMTRLREETRRHHVATEEGPFQQELLAGRLPLASYTALLQQLLHVHRAVESQLRWLASSQPPVAAVLRDYQFQEENILSDLRALHADPATEDPLPSTQSFVDEVNALSRSWPVALLGVHYVLEGSKNGGRYIAKALRRAYGFEDGKGVAYLDPYGDDQKTRWSEFKKNMDAARLNSDDQDAVVAAAQTAFDAIQEIHQELYALMPSQDR